MNKKEKLELLLKTLKQTTVQSVILYLIITLVGAFVMFDITFIPAETWKAICTIHLWKPSERFAALFSWILYWSFSVFIRYDNQRW